MQSAVYILIVLLGWGTWLIFSQNVRYPNPQVKNFYVTIANLVLSFIVLLIVGMDQLSNLSPGAIALLFAGGLIWALGGLTAFTGTSLIGTAAAFGIWAPLNIIVSMLWGALLFAEFPNSDAQTLIRLFAALAAVIGGILLIIFSRGKDKTQKTGKQAALLGYLMAVGAGVFWGSYYIPIEFAQVSMWVGAFPMAVGMLVGSTLLMFLAKKSPRLESTEDVLRTLLTGALWSAGNYGMLLLVGAIGAGRGYAISQISLVVNALVSILILRDPHPKTKTAWLMLLGCVLATVGAILLGSL